MLTDEERAIFEHRLGAARVELVPLDECTPEAERPYRLEARCTVGDWFKHFGVMSAERIDEPGEMRRAVMKQFALAFEASAPPHLFPVAASA